MLQANRSENLFSLGQCVATPGALEALAASGQVPKEFFDRHGCGDWGDVDAEDQQANEDALAAWGAIAFGVSHVVGRSAMDHHRGGSGR